MTTRLEAIEAREREATPGPWLIEGRNHTLLSASGRMIGQIYQRGEHNSWIGTPQDLENMQFIAHARADIPLLLSIARAVAKWVLARQRELALPEHLEADAELDEYESILLEIAAAQDEMQAAIAPLLEDAD